MDLMYTASRPWGPKEPVCVAVMVGPKAPVTVVPFDGLTFLSNDRSDVPVRPAPESMMKTLSVVLLLQPSEDTAANYLYLALARNSILVALMIIRQRDKKFVSTRLFYYQSVN
jgi:hypothetical protein